MKKWMFFALMGCIWIVPLRAEEFRSGKIFDCNANQKKYYCKHSNAKPFLKDLRGDFSKALGVVPDARALEAETINFEENVLSICKSKGCVIKSIDLYREYINGLSYKNKFYYNFKNLLFDEMVLISAENEIVCKEFSIRAGEGVLGGGNWYRKNGVNYAYVDINGDGLYERYFGYSYPYKNETPLQFYGSIVPEKIFNYGLLVDKRNSLEAIINKYSLYPEIGDQENLPYRLKMEIYEAPNSYFIPVLVSGRYYFFVANDFRDYESGKELSEKWHAGLFELNGESWSRICEYGLREGE